MVSMQNQLSKLQIVSNQAADGSTKNFYSAAGVTEGIPKSGIVEIEGSHCIDWFIEFLRASPQATFFWLELNQSALVLRRLIQSRKYDVILANHQFSDARIVATLQIFAKHAGVLLFLVTTNRPRLLKTGYLQLQITSAW